MKRYVLVARKGGRVRLEIPYQSYENGMDFLYAISQVASWYDWTLERDLNREVREADTRCLS